MLDVVVPAERAFFIRMGIDVAYHAAVLRCDRRHLYQVTPPSGQGGEDRAFAEGSNRHHGPHADGIGADLAQRVPLSANCRSVSYPTRSRLTDFACDMI
jgi:hypothetical protein